MPDPADQNARAHAEDAGPPQLRRRRDLRRADGELWDAQTGTMPAVTPNPSVQPDGKPLTRRTSWAEAAAAADAGKPAAPSRPPVSAQPASPGAISSVSNSADTAGSAPPPAPAESPEF